MLEFLPPVWRCGHAIQRGLFAVFQNFKEKVCEAGWGSGVSGQQGCVLGNEQCDTG